MFPAFAPVRRHRPIAIVAPSLVQLAIDQPGAESESPCPRPGPSAAVEVDLTGTAGPVELTWRSGEVALTGHYDGRRVLIEVDDGRQHTVHTSRRHGRTSGTVTGFALTLTGTMLTALTRETTAWKARSRVDLGDAANAGDPRVPTHDETFLRRLRVGHRGEIAALRAGAFGQLGLRDIRAVTYADGTPFREPDGSLWLTATSAGPGFFPTAHTSVWRLDPTAYDLTHTGDLWFRRDGSIYGDHATHVVRDDDHDAWLVATSTWGNFRAPTKADPGVPVGVALATVQQDPRHGEHTADLDPWTLPTDGLASVGVWDPHLVRHDDRWLVGYVSARRYFDFHPALAEGPSLDELKLRAAATDRRATEGTTIVQTSEGRRVLASDGRDNPRGKRARYPIWDLDLQEVGALSSAYVSNLPWPTLIPHEGGWLHVAFDGTPYGGRLPGYGTHGDVVVTRSAEEVD